MHAPVVGLLLAAGRGRRFDAAGTRDKLLQDVAGRAVAARALAALAGACDAVVAVIRPDAPAALGTLLRDGGATVVVCPDADLGMGHSLATAARTAIALHAPAAVLVLPADMPWLRTSSAAAVVAALQRGMEAAADPDAAHASPDDALAATGAATRIVVPHLPDGRRGHPVAFGRAHLAALASLAGERGARTLLDVHPVVPVVVDDAGILRDVDTPSDLPPP
jgi:molybdenum cofactor cytidylyltransferase